MSTNIKEQLAEQLFLSTIKSLRAKLDSGEATHQDVKNAIEFLKNNNINCDIRKGDIPSGLLDDLDLPVTDLGGDLQ